MENNKGHIDCDSRWDTYWDDHSDYMYDYNNDDASNRYASYLEDETNNRKYVFDKKIVDSMDIRKCCIIIKDKEGCEQLHSLLKRYTSIAGILGALYNIPKDKLAITCSNGGINYNKFINSYKVYNDIYIKISKISFSILTYSCTNILDCIVDNSEKEWNDTEELCEDIIYI